MATPKKGSRTIEVDDIRYRWRIRQRATNSQRDFGVGVLHVVVQLDQGPGAILVLKTDRAHPADWGDRPIVPVLPSDIEGWIRQARALGWSPSTKGSPFLACIDGPSLRRDG